FGDGGAATGQVIKDGLSVSEIGNASEGLVGQRFRFQQRDSPRKICLGVGVGASNLDFASDDCSRANFSQVLFQADPCGDASDCRTIDSVTAAHGTPHRIDREIGTAAISPVQDSLDWLSLRGVDYQVRSKMRNGLEAMRIDI